MDSFFYIFVGGGQESFNLKSKLKLVRGFVFRP